MKKNTRFSLIILLIISQLLINSLNIKAIPAYPFPIKFLQPDGSSIDILLKGDEKVKWAETIDGYSILFNKNGTYEYAIQDIKGDMIPSGKQARNQNERTNDDNYFLNTVQKGLIYSSSQVSLMKSIWNIQKAEAQRAFPTTGSRNLICILIGFTDLAFTKTQAEFNNLFNQLSYTTDGATGSVKDYYNECSYGQLNLSVTVAGPYTAANNMAYYGANDVNGNDAAPQTLAAEAVNLANSSVNYANFDNDADGYVDGVYMIYAGYGEEAGASSNAIWAHAWSLSTTLYLDGKYISRYSCSPELRSSSGTGITRIGVICHEFGHVLGAPDYYDTDYSTGGQYDGTGYWDMMASGSWNNSGATPAHHNAYTKTPNSHLAGQGCFLCRNEKIAKHFLSPVESVISRFKQVHSDKYDYSSVEYIRGDIKVKIICPIHGLFEQRPEDHLTGRGCPSCATYGFDRNKPAVLYYLKITTENGQMLYKIGITNRTVEERFQLKDLEKIEIVKQKLYENGQDAYDWEQKLLKMYKQYQYTGPNILVSGNTEVFTEDIIAMYYTG